MGLFFTDELLDVFGTSPLGYTSTGGLTLGEVQAVSAAARDGNASAFYEAWVALGDRLAQQASQARDDGDLSTARLYGLAVEPRLPAAFAKQIAAFDAGLAIGAHPVENNRDSV